MTIFSKKWKLQESAINTCILLQTLQYAFNFYSICIDIKVFFYIKYRPISFANQSHSAPLMPPIRKLYEAREFSIVLESSFCMRNSITVSREAGLIVYGNWPSLYVDNSRLC